MRHRFLFEISHPKHFYQFQPVAKKLMRDNDVLLISRDKDVSLELIAGCGLPWKPFGRHGKNMKQKLFFTPFIIRDYLKVLLAFKPHFIISRSSPYSVVSGTFVKAKSIIMPDSEVVFLINHFAAPMADFIITPSTFSRDFGRKHHRLNGLFEESYLHPAHFHTDETVRETLGVSESERFFVLRFVAWHASHDFRKAGFSQKQKEELINLLIKYGRVFISSEAALPDSLVAFRLPTPANKIHSVLHYASLYIGDSQTMATESALLGTPSIRFNSFVGQGDMSNFKVLEQTYDMIRNLGSFGDVLSSAKDLLVDAKAKTKWLQKREWYFLDRPDINQQTIDLFQRFLTCQL